jgi:hypothetical protein
MQLPFFGWTAWRVYEEMKKVNKKDALDFLMEVYPCVRANTEAIRTALDPYNEAILSGYDPNKYWRGPTWMSSTKPVIDGFYSYGYEMLYLYLVSLSVATLQDGRAVEHWKPETGEINISNVNFSWAASCMAGSIRPELTDSERSEYLKRFHT